MASRLIRATMAAIAVAAVAGTVAHADPGRMFEIGPALDIGPLRPIPPLLQRQENPGHTLSLCADPTPLQIRFDNGTTYIPYHGHVPAVIIRGTVTNLGPGVFTPGGGQQEIQLWIKWGSGTSHSLLATVPLGPLGVGQNQTMEGAVAVSDYGGLFDIHGAPHIRLMVVSSAGDCHTGLSNQAAGYGPPLSDI